MTGRRRCATNEGDHVWQRDRQCRWPLIGLDPHEILFQPEVAGIDLRAALEVIAGAILRVDVDRAHQPFLPERPIGRMVPDNCGHGRR